VKSLVSALNDFQPRLLVSYASMLGTLAGAQLAGDLHLSPAKVIAASEVLPADGRAAAQRAWGRDVVVDTYAATETAGIASTCEQGRWHLYEDLVIVEAVDDDCQAVPVGASGTRLLVTPLFTRTFPLIRYELTDAVRLEPGSCPCGRPFALLGAVEGRTEDTLTLPGAAGGVRVHPVVFHTALESLSPDGWQVEQTDTGLVVRLAGRATQDHLARARVLDALTELGVTGLQVDVRLVPSIERTPLGKAPLVKAPPAS
jgi:phenylacetate-coenzyme A ligase PaaK-like adenylate-forming protein